MNSSFDCIFKPVKYPAAYEKLSAILGKGSVSSRGVDRLAYCRDVWPISVKWMQQSKFPFIPDIIAWPRDTEDVAAVLSIANQYKLNVIPFGGGSGSVGGALPVSDSILIDLKRMDKIISLDEISLCVTVETGKFIQDLEDELNLLGYTLGHFPQSMHSACVGGCIAHNGIGTFSTKYGKLDDMVLGMQVVMPDSDILNIIPVPKSSTGPNLNELFLGSEGTLGVVTHVTLKIHKMPEYRLFRSYAVDDMRKGFDLIRQLLQYDLRPAVVRLYDKSESTTKFEALNLPGNQCLLNLCFEGFREIVEFEESISAKFCKMLGATYLGSDMGETWYAKKRFDVSKYIAWMRGHGHIFDALEISSTWDKLADLYYEVRRVMEQYSDKVMGHSSHVYPQGGNLYMIFFAKTKSQEGEALEELYNKILGETFHVCQRLGAAISHHHGIGIAKAEWMPLQHGQTGMEVLNAIKRGLDPENIMNPGKLGLGK